MDVVVFDSCSAEGSEETIVFEGAERSTARRSFCRCRRGYQSAGEVCRVNMVKEWGYLVVS